MVRYICNFLSCGIGYGAGTIILIDLYGLRIKLVVAVRIFMYNIFKHTSIIIINNIYLESSVFCFFFFHFQTVYLNIIICIRSENPKNVPWDHFWRIIIVCLRCVTHAIPVQRGSLYSSRTHAESFNWSIKK